ncbi:hypothetical protein M3484_13390 [Pseudomonas sp. GX19020]|uniref:hypothetical protein n=1 Tax=Pseudomonas sp. GX19020 TaxID=2942277 RepID=UPI002018CF25|nr:hypothetical protein [Pseudomonas sp. GX19020]MCL4067565.1 hypothetical protein [Pseudomonas sp. GX19020]
MSSRSLLTLIIAALLLIAIGIGTLMPGGALPQMPGSDKMQHFGAFALVALVVTLLRPGWVLPVALVLVAYGGLIELIQPLVGRSRELADFVADSLGVAAGSLTGLILHQAIQRLQRGTSDTVVNQTADNR